jgi:hypothetical protein
MKIKQIFASIAQQVSTQMNGSLSVPAKYISGALDVSSHKVVHPREGVILPMVKGVRK